MDDIHISPEQDSDWYRVTRRDIEKRGGVRLFDRYHSVEEILCAAYPELRWEPFKFLEGNNTVRGYWSSIVHQRDFFDRIGNELGIQKVCTTLAILYTPDTLLAKIQISQLIGIEFHERK